MEAICLLGIIVFNSSVLQQESTRQFAEKTTLATGLLLEMLVNPLSQSDLSTARVVSQRFVNKEGLVKFEFFATDRNRLLMVNNQKYKTVQHELDQLSDQHFNSQRQTRLGGVFTVGDYSFITVQDALSISGNKVGTARFVYDISRNTRAIEDAQLNNLIITWLCIVISTIVALILGFHIARSLEDASDIAAIIAHHREMNMPAYNPQGDEIDRLYHSIHLMQQSIRRRETALTLERERALAASKAKSEFLAVMSHEIRTPINGITGALSLLDKRKLSSDDVEQVNIAQTSSELLLTVINDILDYSKIEAGKFQINPVPGSIYALVEEIATVYRPLITAKGIEFAVDSEAVREVYVHADEIRIRQILSNYLNNALKFTDKGQIKLCACLSDSGELQFTVADSGIGIQPDDMSKLFKDFSQVHDGISRKFGGTGLGLVISKKLAGLMNGRVGAESVAGVGSQFSVYLQPDFITEAEYQQQTKGRQNEETAAPVTENIHILLVEDNLINQKVAGRTLEKAGCLVSIANNGLEALQLLEQENPFDLVLMDCQMPVMDGLTATRELRKRGNDIPVIALTASALESDRQSCIDAGMNDFLTKPFEVHKLYATINHYTLACAA
ncbi:MAG: response regulator [Thiolinea sp.]